MKQQAPYRKPNPAFVLLILWAAMLATQAVFVFVARTATSGALSAPDQVAMGPARGSLSVPMFAGLAIVSLLLAIFLPKLLMKPQIAKLEQTGGPVPIEKLVPIAVTGKIIRWAMLESITIYGLMLALFNADPNIILPFAAVALIGFALTFPSEKSIRGFLGVN